MEMNVSAAVLEDGQSAAREEPNNEPPIKSGDDFRYEGGTGVAKVRVAGRTLQIELYWPPKRRRYLIVGTMRKEAGDWLFDGTWEWLNPSPWNPYRHGVVEGKIVSAKTVSLTRATDQGEHNLTGLNIGRQ